MSDLHAKIMNLECNEPDLNRTSVAPAYRLGHRDARHAAAELVAAHQDRIEALTAAPSPDVLALVEALQRIEDLTQHNMGMTAAEERCVNREARAALARITDTGGRKDG